MYIHKKYCLQNKENVSVIISGKWSITSKCCDFRPQKENRKFQGLGNTICTSYYMHKSWACLGGSEQNIPLELSGKKVNMSTAP